MPHQVSSPGFHQEGTVVLSGVRRALSDILAGVGADPTEPQEVSRRFGVDKTLAWRISRVVCEVDVWEAVPHIPRRPSIQIFANALAKHGAGQQTVDDLWHAVEDFESFIQAHAGDRETLEMMASGLSKHDTAKRLENFRKDGFQSNCAIWGVCARVLYALRVLTPSKTPGLLDLTTICGLVDFRRLRSDVAWTAATLRAWDFGASTSAGSLASIELLDGNGHGNGSGIRPDKYSTIPLVKRFCSNPLPALHTALTESNETRFVLNPGPVGNTAASTLMLGWTCNNLAPARQSHAGEVGEHGFQINTPAELLIHDLFVHRSLEFAMHPSAHVYGLMPGGPGYPPPRGQSEASAQSLPVPSDVIDLDDTAGNAGTSEFPESSEIVEFAAAQLGMALTELRGFRRKLKYPPIPAISILRHALLPAS